jgi:hypothetical protein
VEIERHEQAEIRVFVLWKIGEHEWRGLDFYQERARIWWWTREYIGVGVSYCEGAETSTHDPVHS